jgi:hypothetical protein
MNTLVWSGVVCFDGESEFVDVEFGERFKGDYYATAVPLLKSDDLALSARVASRYFRVEKNADSMRVHVTDRHYRGPVAWLVWRDGPWLV